MITIKRLTALLTIVLLISYLSGIAGAARGRSSVKNQWQYKTVEIRLNSVGEPERTLNQLGDEGWEVVHLRVDENTAGLGGHYLLKRIK